MRTAFLFLFAIGVALAIDAPEPPDPRNWPRIAPTVEWLGDIMLVNTSTTNIDLKRRMHRLELGYSSNGHWCVREKP